MSNKIYEFHQLGIGWSNTYFLSQVNKRKYYGPF